MENLENLKILWHLNTPSVALALPSLRVQGALLQGVRMLRLNSRTVAPFLKWTFNFKMKRPMSKIESVCDLGILFYP